jgi:predicted RNA binding protein YcfA (HicA-like mRNA interferase family)
VRYREIAHKLRTLGCQELPRRRGTSHRKWYNPQTERIAPVPDWGSKDPKIGTLRRIVQQLGLDWDAFKQA